MCLFLFSLSGSAASSSLGVGKKNRYLLFFFTLSPIVRASSTDEAVMGKQALITGTLLFKWVVLY